MKLTKPLAVLLAMLMLTAASGCAATEPASNPPPPSSQPAVVLSDSERFEQLIMEHFDEIVSDNLVEYTFLLENPESYGVGEVNKRLGKIDFDELDNTAELWRQDTDELNSFNYYKLTDEQQLIYDLLDHQSELMEPVLSMAYYDEINSPLLGVQSQLPTTLAELRLDTAQEAQDYIDTLATIGDYFDDMAEYQRRRSAKGLFMSDRMADSVIDYCRSFADEGEACLLIEGFPERLEQFADLGKAERDRLVDGNRRVVLDEVLPTYDSFADALEQLKGSGRADEGMCALPEGKTYYEYMVAMGSGSDWDIDKMITAIDDTLKSNHREIYSLILSDRDALRRLEAVTSAEQEPKQIMQNLIERCEGRFPALSALQYDIKYVHPSQEENSSPAFYYIPPIDSSGGNTIYINRRYIDGYQTLYSLLGHEGYPGHMYQNNYVVQMKAHPMRRLLESAGYAEGWAKYVENLCYEMAGIDDHTVVRFMQLSNDTDMLLSTRIDIGVNYEGWDLEQVIDELARYNIADDEVAEQIYHAVIDEPANYVKYAVGYLEFVALRHRAEVALGDRFDELEYHRAVLDQGSVPFSFVSAAVDCYISDGLIASSGRAA